MTDNGTEPEAVVTAGAGDSVGKDRLFTQEQVNSILADQKRKVHSQFADYADLKAKAEAHDAALEAAKTDAEKAIDAARQEGETAARQAADARVVRAEAKVALAGANARNADVAARLLDLNGITVGDDGEVDAAALKAKVDALKESDPYLFDDGKKQPPKPDRSQGGGGGGDDRPSLDRGRAMFEQRRGKKTA